MKRTFYLMACTLIGVLSAASCDGIEDLLNSDWFRTQKYRFPVSSVMRQGNDTFMLFLLTLRSL